LILDNLRFCAFALVPYFEWLSLVALEKLKDNQIQQMLLILAELMCNIVQQVNKLLAGVMTMLDGRKNIWLPITTLKFVVTKAHCVSSL
jgi:hypothetical protein